MRSGGEIRERHCYSLRQTHLLELLLYLLECIYNAIQVQHCRLIYAAIASTRSNDEVDQGRQGWTRGRLVFDYPVIDCHLQSRLWVLDGIE